MNDERFERSADMRLVELQRERLGLGVPTTSWQRSTHDLPHASADPTPAAQTGAVLVATIDAQPRVGLIAGALVTAACALVNDGDREASDATFSMPMPFEATFRPGTLAIDGAPASDASASEIFAEGLRVGTIAPGARLTIVFKLLIDVGREAVLLAPHVRTEQGAVIGPVALRLTRGKPSAAPGVIERPFYESDAAEAALEPIEIEPARIAVIQPAELPLPPIRENEQSALPAPKLVTESPAKREPVAPKVKPKPKPKLKAARPKVERAVKSGLEIVGGGGPVLTVAIDRKRLDSLRSLFGGRSLGMTAHYLILSGLAAIVPLRDDGVADDLATFVAAQERLLLRALILARLGKPPVVDTLAAELPHFPTQLIARTGSVAVPTVPAQIVLARAYTESETLFIARMLANAEAPPFLRAAQLLVGIVASDVMIADMGLRHHVSTALRLYAGLAAGEINRIFLRSKLSRSPEYFKETDSAFDAAARAALDALGTALA